MVFVHHEALGEAATHEQKSRGVGRARERSREPPGEHSQCFALPRLIGVASEQEHLAARANHHLDAAESPRASDLEDVCVWPEHDIGHRGLHALTASMSATEMRRRAERASSSAARSSR